MKTTNRVGLVLAFQMLLAINLSAQVADSVNASKVDELSAGSNCEEVLARLDNFLINLQNDPTATSVIAIYGEKARTPGGRASSVRHRAFQILSWAGMKRFDESRISVIQGETREDPKTEFWLVPAGATPPEINGVPWSYDLSNQTEAFHLGTEFSDGVAGCDGGNPYLYAEFLKANSSMRGNIVIGASSTANYRLRAKETLDELIKKGVSRGRLKTFFVKVKPNL